MTQGTAQAGRGVLYGQIGDMAAAATNLAVCRARMARWARFWASMVPGRQEAVAIACILECAVSCVEPRPQRIWRELVRGAGGIRP